MSALSDLLRIIEFHIYIIYIFFIKYINAESIKFLGQSVDHFSFLRSIINIPLKLSSSTMTVLNSMDEGGNKNMKYANIILNIWTSLMLSLVGNFKFPEQATNFSQIQVLPYVPNKHVDT